MHDSVVSEDIAEETFAAIIVSARHFNPKATLKVYLYKIIEKNMQHIGTNAPFDVL